MIHERDYMSTGYNHQHQHEHKYKECSHCGKQNELPESLPASGFVFCDFCSTMLDLELPTLPTLQMQPPIIQPSVTPAARRYEPIPTLKKQDSGIGQFVSYIGQTVCNFPLRFWNYIKTGQPSLERNTKMQW